LIDSVDLPTPPFWFRKEITKDMDPHSLVRENPHPLKRGFVE
jgi:hypothetical protein